MLQSDLSAARDGAMGVRALTATLRRVIGQIGCHDTTDPLGDKNADGIPCFSKEAIPWSIVSTAASSPIVEFTIR